MSSIAISGNTSGTGEFSLEAPVTTADHNITLADASGNVVISDGTTITADYTNNRFSFGGTVVFNGLTTGFNRWQILNANTNLVANKNYFANTQTTLTLTLPATANIGDTIRVFDNEGHASANVVTISRNGNKIDGFDRNVVISTDRDGVELVYVSGDIGFVTREAKTERRFFGTQSQGESFGYNSGGFLSTPLNVIEKYPFSVDTNASDVGDLSLARAQTAGQSSDVSGYVAGGQSSPPPSGTPTAQIDKFPFAVDTNSIDIGDLTQSRREQSGNQSVVSGYAVGGTDGTLRNTIDKFPFATDTNATDVGNLATAKRAAAGQSSVVFGYASGGNSGSGTNSVEKFPFATDTNATDTLNLTQARWQVGGCSSATHGYTIGGYFPPGNRDTIDKFPFATDTNATDVGNLLSTAAGPGGTASLTFGYSHGGSAPPELNTIQKFPFATDSNATDVGDLTGVKSLPASTGQQV